jgi:hypothetical protein
MVKKDNKNLWIIIGVIAVGLLLIQPGGLMNTSQNVQDLIARFSGGGGTTNANLGNPNVDFLSIRLYDVNGDLIKQPGTFSTVTISGVVTKGVYFMDYTVMVDNTGATDLSCNLQSITPAAIGVATSCGVSATSTITATALNIPAGGKQTWTSNKLPVGGSGVGCNFESIFSTAIPITATVRCTYIDGQGQVQTLTDVVGQFPPSGGILAQAAGTAGFTVSVAAGGVPTEYCGDGTCQSPLENSANCAADCNPLPNVNFRTSDRNYISGSAIAATVGATACGSVLNAFGYTTTTCNAIAAPTEGTCPTKAGYTCRVLGTSVGCPSWAMSGSACLNAYLFEETAAPAHRIVMFKQPVANVGPCGTANQLGQIEYNSADGDASKVSTQIKAYDLAKEKTC